MRNDPSGSNWRKWEFHFHTPASFDYKDQSVTDQDIINGLIAAGVSAVVTRPAFDNRDGKYQCEKSQLRPRHRSWPLR